MTDAVRPTASLGKLLSEHKARIIAPLGVFLLAVILAIFGAFNMKTNPSSRLISVGLFFFAFVMLIWAGWLYSRCIEIREHGIQYKTMFGEKAWHWSEFDALSFEIRQTHYSVYFIPVGSYLSQSYTLSINNKNVLHLTDLYSDGLAGGEILMNLTKQVFLPRYLKQLKQGETVSFGRRIKVSKAGITQGRKEIPWNTIKDVEMMQGQLSITRIPRGHQIISIQKIPNGHVLVELVAMALQSQPRRHSY